MSSRSWPLGAMFALALCGLCELATRTFFHPGVVDRDTWQAFYPAYDSGFSDIPVCLPVGDELSCGPTPYLNVHRDSFPRKKPRGEFRIITVGASVARGGSTSYSSKLETRMKRTLGEHAVRVINLAASAIGAQRQRLRMKEALRYQPDLIILHVHGTNEARDARELGYSAQLHRGIGGLLLESRFVVMAKRYLNAKLALEGHVQATNQARSLERAEQRGKKGDRQYQKVMQDNTRAMLAMARAHKVAVIVVGRAHKLSATYDVEEEQHINDFLRAQCSGRVKYFDFEAAAEKLRPKKRVRFFKNTTHLSAAGNGYIAGQLEPLVLSIMHEK